MSERYGWNNTQLKNENRGIVLQMIAGGRLSRADITKRIKLTKMTVSNIVAELIRDGYIEEKETAENASVGRNPVLLDIAPTAPLTVGIYLSRTDLWVQITDLKLNVIYQDRCPLELETAGTLAEKLYDLTDTALAALGKEAAPLHILGIGVSAIGPLDSRAGVILRPPDFYGIVNFPIVQLLRERYALPVFLANDMKASALAEKLYGQGVNLDNFMYLGISNGIGSGVITSGRLYQDNSGFVGEIGHMCIEFDGAECSCGNRGCLEVYANMPVILQKLRLAAGKPDLSCEDFERLSSIPACRAIFLELTQKLSVALVNAVNLLDPECIMIGHEGAFLPSTYLSMLGEMVNSRILAAGYKKIPVIKSSFGNLAPLFGSVCCVLGELFAGQLFI